MSTLYVETNSESADDLYDKRIIYRSRISKEPYNNIVDFNFAEKFFYGRVSRHYVPIIIKGNEKTKRFSSSAAAVDNLSAMNFVVDAFEKLAQQFRKCAATGKIHTSDPYLSNLVVHKAYTDPKKLYDEHLTSRINFVVSRFKNERIRVQDFDEFILKLIPLLEEMKIRTIPFTEPAFVKSRYCPINASGLVVEIADLDPTNDDDKINKFLNSKNWAFYVNACNSYGFMVDRFIPWRLVADIGSQDMIKEYASKYGIDHTNKVFRYNYKTVHAAYFLKFRYYMLNLYNKIKVKDYTVQEQCDGRTVNKIITPQTYTKYKFDNLYSELYFLKLYFKIRFMEEESKFEPSERKNLIDDCLQLYSSQNLGVALKNFERILNKPFDYNGSLSYYYKYTNVRRELDISNT